ncbi:MAG: DJ-1/PfpI family protein, partial [Opitutales bacterium]|nr:DJ-1/PfpI family protein [Opitutales bacterium]
MKSALVIIFKNFEETEAIAPIDILKRAGADVKIATMSANLETSGRSGVQIRADVFFESVKDATFDAVIVSGGPGTMNIAEDPSLLAFIKRH